MIEKITESKNKEKSKELIDEVSKENHEKLCEFYKKKTVNFTTLQKKFKIETYEIREGTEEEIEVKFASCENSEEG
jgi:hypothetical protein